MKMMMKITILIDTNYEDILNDIDEGIIVMYNILLSHENDGNKKDI